MTDQPEEAEIYHAGLEITWRPFSLEPKQMIVEVGGTIPTIIIGVRLPDDGGDADFNFCLDVTGVEHETSLISLFRGIADHIETEASTVFSVDGVERREALKPHPTEEPT
jgi:hypothetical protein